MMDDRSIRRRIVSGGKRVAVTMIGMVLIVVGVVLTAIPGIPGIFVVVAGFAVMASEYTWARRAVDGLRQRLARGSPKNRRT